MPVAGVILDSRYYAMCDDPNVLCDDTEFTAGGRRLLPKTVREPDDHHPSVRVAKRREEGARNPYP